MLNVAFVVDVPLTDKSYPPHFQALGSGLSVFSLKTPIFYIMGPRKNKPNRRNDTKKAASSETKTPSVSDTPVEPVSIFESVTLPTITISTPIASNEPDNTTIHTPPPDAGDFFTPLRSTLNKHTQANRSVSRLDLSTPRVNLSGSFNREASPAATPSNFNMSTFSLSGQNASSSSFCGLGKIPIYEDNQIDELRKTAYHVRVGTKSLQNIPTDHPVLMGSLIKGSFEVPDHVVTAVHRVLRSKQQLVRRSKFCKSFDRDTHKYSCELL